jgi:hypothetical protein
VRVAACTHGKTQKVAVFVLSADGFDRQLKNLRFTFSSFSTRCDPVPAVSLRIVLLVRGSGAQDLTNKPTHGTEESGPMFQAIFSWRS